MKRQTIVNFPGGAQVDIGRRTRFRHGDQIEQGPHVYEVQQVWIRSGLQIVNLQRA